MGEKDSKEKKYNESFGEKTNLSKQKHSSPAGIALYLWVPWSYGGRHLATMPCAGEAEEPELTWASLVVRHQSHGPSGGVTPLAPAVGWRYSSRSRDALDLE